VLAIMHQRLMVGMLLFGLIIVAVLLRLTWLGLFGDHAGRQAGPSALLPVRGDIVDREGNPLARTIDSWTVALQPDKIIGDRRVLAANLARLMPERDAAGWLAEIQSGKTFIYLRRRAAPRLVQSLNALGEPASPSAANLTACIRRPTLPPMCSVIRTSTARARRAWSAPSMRSCRTPRAVVSPWSFQSAAGSSRRWSMSF
jgi:hypothetical protein